MPHEPVVIHETPERSSLKESMRYEVEALARRAVEQTKEYRKLRDKAEREIMRAATGVARKAKPVSKEKQRDPLGFGPPQNSKDEAKRVSERKKNRNSLRKMATTDMFHEE